MMKNSTRVMEQVGNGPKETGQRLQADALKCSSSVNSIKAQIAGLREQLQQAQDTMLDAAGHTVEQLKEAQLTATACHNKISAATLDLSRKQDALTYAEGRMNSWIGTYEALITAREDAVSEAKAAAALVEFYKGRIAGTNKHISGRPKYGSLTLKYLKQIQTLEDSLSNHASN